MGWNIDGTFTRTNGQFTGSDVWQKDQQASIKIIASRHDINDQDMAIGIQNCLNLQGYNAMAANLNMGGNSIVNVAIGTELGDIALFDQLIKDGVFDSPSRNLTLNLEDGTSLDPINIPVGDTSATEGEWTPQLINSSTGADNATMAIQNKGYWQRNGRVVTLMGKIVWVNRVDSSLRVTLKGIPFAPAPAVAGAELDMFTSPYMALLGMELSGIALGTGGGQAFTQSVFFNASQPLRLNLMSYSGTNNAPDQFPNQQYFVQMTNLSSVGGFSFTLMYTTDD